MRRGLLLSAAFLVGASLVAGCSPSPETANAGDSMSGDLQKAQDAATDAPPRRAGRTNSRPPASGEKSGPPSGG